MPFKDPTQHAETIKGYTKKYRLKQATIPYEDKIKPPTKLCYKCNIEKPIDLYYKDKYSNDGHKDSCIECNKKHSASYREQNLDKCREYGRLRYNSNPEIDKRSYFLRLYNISIDYYNKLIELQNDSCAICKSTKPSKTRKNWSVDHNHQTGVVRGLLCQNCNAGLGMFRDNVNLLIEATKYLIKHDTVSSQNGLDC